MVSSRMSEFEATLQRLNARTAKVYSRATHHLDAFLSQSGYPDPLPSDVCDRFVSWCMKQNLALATTETYLSVLRRYLRWRSGGDLPLASTSSSMLERTKMLKRGVFDLPQLRKMMTVVASAFPNTYAGAACVVMIGGGLLPRQVLSLEPGDVWSSKKSRVVFVDRDGAWGGACPRWVPLLSEAMSALDSGVVSCRASRHRKTLFGMDSEGHGIQMRDLYRCLATLSGMVHAYVIPQELRRSYLSVALKRNVDMPKVRYVAGLACGGEPPSPETLAAAWRSAKL